MIQRIFHPIGQGAFYSERHDNFNIVYDCGNWRNTRLADKVVKQAFHAGDVIDILFISHFDADHVNKVKVLKAHTTIRKVVLPLLHDNQVSLLCGIYNALGKSYQVSIDLMRDPEGFFGEGTDIIRVSPAVNEAINDNDDAIEPISIDSLSNGDKINSGTVLTIDAEWIYIPYNHMYVDRAQVLAGKMLKIKNFDDALHDSKVRNDVKKIYDQLNGKINQNSMMVYSGPLVNSKRKYHRHIFSREHKACCHYDCYYDHNRVACIYTGDGDLNVVNIASVYQKYWDKVGTIQIPHHGDIKSFNGNFFTGGGFCCPISVGTNNSYGHPSSKVIADILGGKNCPIQVTEKLNSVFVEDIC